MMEIKYSEQEFVDAYNAVMQAENTDAYPAHVWARYAVILADVVIFEQVVATEVKGGKVVLRLEEMDMDADYGGHA